MVRYTLALALALCASPVASQDPPSSLVVPARVVSVYDGDTITVEAWPWPGWIREVSVRIVGIDAPEVRGPCKQMGKDVRDLLRKMVDGREVTLHDIRKGTYAGRVVARVELKGVDVGGALIAAGAVREYDGGKREPWC